MSQVQSGASKKQMIVIGVVVLALLALAVYGVMQLLAGNAGGKPKAPKISLIPTAPPPPPPPPPKIERKPEPPKEEKQVRAERPQEKIEAPPAAPQLKMEGAAGNGPSAFGGGAITSEDLSKLGSGAGGIGGERTNAMDPFKNYAGALKGELQRHLAKNSDLRRSNYRVEVRVWVGNDGALKRAELVGTTGDGETDELIRQAMTGLAAFSDAPPANMPQPIRLRIVTTGRA